MKRNILLSYVLTYLYNSWFWLGVWVFYYLRFTDYKGIGLIETIMIILSICLEVPTGVVADHIGKKKTLFLAFLLSGIGNIVFGFSTNFNYLIFSVATFCVGSALYSGTMEALQYDSLKQGGKEKQFAKVMAKTNTLVMIAWAVSSVIGGYIYNFWPGLPFILLGVLQFSGAILVFGLKEPRVDSEKVKGFGSFWKDQVRGFVVLRRNLELKKMLSFLLAGGVVAVICSQALNDLLGYEFGFSPEYFGLIAAVMYLLSALTSHFAPKFVDKFDRLKLIIILCVLMAFTLVLSPWLSLIWGTLVLGLRWSVQSIFDVVSSDTINQKIESDFRATTLSSFNMLKNLPYAFTAVVLGGAMDGLGVRNFAYFLGLGLMIFVIGARLIRHRDL